jgi:hypothetical protein
MFAVPITLTFRDTSTATRTLIWAENPSYPQPTPTDGSYERWIYKVYKTTDSVIDPLGSDGLPTNDDVAVTNVGHTGNVNIGPTGGVTFNAPGINCPDPGSDPNVAYHSSGHKIYYRIYNASSVAAATKYLVWASPYTVLSATATVNFTPTPGWAASGWFSKAVTPLVSGTILSSLPVNGVVVSCTGQLNVTTNVTGQFNFSVTPGSDITITPTKTGYYFVPANRTYTNVQEAITGIEFAMVKRSPNVAVNPTPATGTTAVLPTLGKVQWDYTPDASYALPTGFKVYFPDTAPAEFVPYQAGVTHYELAIPILSYSTTYNWRVIPTNDNKETVMQENVTVSREGTKEIKADSDGTSVWSFSTRNPHVINYGMETPLDPDGNGPLGTFYFNNGEDEAPYNVFMTVIPLANVPEFPGHIITSQAFALNLASGGVNDVFIRVPAGTWYAVAYYNGMWNQGTSFPTTGPGIIAWYNIPFVGKGDVPVVVSGGGDPTLPVELSSFTAMYTAGFFVQLTWIVQSETNHLGYNVLRNGTSTLATAIKVNSEVISSGSSEGTQITYGFRDDEVDPNSTYYYWLESVDLDGATHFFGPVSVVIGNPDTPDTPPIIPTVTELLNAYPNPFNPITTIPYTIKKAGDVKIEIFNVKGQMIWNYEYNHDKAGYFQISWNGRDNNAKPVASGVYYYRMTSGKYTASKKIVLVK